MTEPTTLALIAAALALTGVLAGISAGLLGIGGGIVMVPALYYMEGLLGVADGVRMHVAVGTSLSVIAVTAMTSVAAHWKAKAVDLDILKSYGPGVAAGVAAGTAISAVVSGAVLTAVFAAIAVLVAANMAAGEPRFTLGEKMPGGLGGAALGAVTGIVSTMAGIGGGAMTVSITTLHSLPIHRAVGTASAVGVIVALPGALGFAAIGWGQAELPPLSVGYVNLAGFAVLAPVTAFMAPRGARLAHRLPHRILARVFAAFLFAAALRMIWNLVF